MELQVIDVRELREKRERQIADLEGRIEQRKRNLRITERYLRIFGRCFTALKIARLQIHIMELRQTISEMSKELKQLPYKPLY